MILGELKVLKYEYVFNNFADSFVPTTFSRFSNDQRCSHGNAVFYILQFSQGYKVSTTISTIRTRLYTLQISQGFQSGGDDIDEHRLSFVPI